MKDRIPTPGQEGRVQIEYEDGTKVIAKISMADNPTEQGTPFATATMLTDETAVLFGLNGDAVPNAVLAFLGKYNQHWWRVTHGIAGYVYHAEKADLTSNTTFIAYNSGTTSASVTMYYSDSIEIDQATGEVSLVDPQELSVNRNGSSNALSACKSIAALAPTYIRYSGKIYYLPEGATAGDGTGYSVYYDSVSGYSNRNIILSYRSSVSAKAINVVSEWKDAGEVTYERSLTRDAFEEGEHANGDYYDYLGVPFDNAVTVPKIITGSYAGTGTYGANNPNQLSFDFAPKLLWVVAKWDGLSYTSISHFADGESITLGEFLTTEYKSGAGIKSDTSTTPSYGKKSEDGKTIHWYNTNSADSQLNSASYNYYWIALG